MPYCGKDGDNGGNDDLSCDSPVFSVADSAERGGDGRANCSILRCLSISFDY